MIHPCDKPCGNKAASGYCATTTCINPQYSNLGTAHYGQGVQKSIITNYDRLRAKSVEEMAEFIAEGFPKDVCRDRCGGDESFPCSECVLDWLKQEVDG